MIQRVRDWLLERRIQRLKRRVLRLRGPEAIAAWDQMRRLLLSRSPKQVERMERRMGLRDA